MRTKLDEELVIQKIRFYQLVNGSIAFAYVAFAVWGAVQIIW